MSSVFSVVIRLGRHYHATDSRFKTVKEAFSYVMDNGSRMMGVSDARIFNSVTKEFTNDRWTPQSYEGNTPKEVTKLESR